MYTFHDLAMSMEKHKCKLCSKKFLNGKALGGHMRSHLMTLPPKTPPLNQDSGESSTLSLCSSEENQEVLELQNKDNVLYGLRENPKKSYRMIDPEFLEDRESETESTKTGKRSKRSRKMVASDEKMKPLSLFSNCSSDEDIAMCLMMLSRDVWKSSSETLEVSKVRKYQCGTCYKMFKTSQALGSHKTIHKNKNKNLSTFIEEQNIKEDNAMDEAFHEHTEFGKVVVDSKLHECPFCGKRFKSGQALGGHKRSHLIIMSSSTTAGSCSSKLGDSLMEYSNSVKNSGSASELIIDLNMPAPMEDEDFSQQPDFSAVSDADFQLDQEHE